MTLATSKFLFRAVGDHEAECIDEFIGLRDAPVLKHSASHCVMSSSVHHRPFFFLYLHIRLQQITGNCSAGKLGGGGGGSANCAFQSDKVANFSITCSNS